MKVLGKLFLEAAGRNIDGTYRGRAAPLIFSAHAGGHPGLVHPRPSICHNDPSTNSMRDPYKGLVDDF